MAQAEDNHTSSSGTSNLVYVQTKNEKWVPARLVQADEETATVEIPLHICLSTIGEMKEHTVELKDYTNKVLPLQNVNKDGKLKEVADMVDLPFLHEAAILYNLKSRHGNSKPYTRTGDIVMAINPFKWMHSLYTPEMKEHYSRNLVWENDDGNKIKSVQPHVYEASALAYRGLAKQKQNQSILVSGESGAGKTETVKICMAHLAMVQEGPNGAGGISSVVQRVVESNPLLEAFGNAKTRRNDNSSRFGKYLQLQFDGFQTSEGAQLTTSSLVGSFSQVYLLEKNRVVHHAEGERNFHIFYQLLSSSDETKGQFWNGLRGKTGKSFNYIGANDTISIEGKADSEHFKETIKALALVGVEGSKLKTLMTSLCVVLQLGNISFQGDDDSSQVSSIQELKDLAALLGLSDVTLCAALTERTMNTRTDSYRVPLNADFAKDSRDAMAKEIYHKTFVWLVEQINAATKVETVYGKSFGIIGLLDIFGFESFETNGFEQLCINYANEKLQQKFTDDIFKTVQTEYQFEGLALDDIYYDDNANVVEVIESPMGLLAMLNEECVRPKGNDREFVYKAISENRRSPALIVDKKHSAVEFGIRHYCAEVIYNADGFISKNNDTLSTDLQVCARQSENEIISGTAEQEKSLKRHGSNVVAPSVWTKYREGLNNLMSDLKKTQSRYIRCIKPNEQKQPLILDNALALDQLRSAGVVAAITISRSAFPNRLDHPHVWERFRGLFPKNVDRESVRTTKGLAKNIESLLCATLKHMETQNNCGTVKAYAIGKTRIYFRAGVLEYLEGQRFKGMGPAATHIQAVVRSFLTRRCLTKEAAQYDMAASKIQTLVRRKCGRIQATKPKKSSKLESLRRMQAAREKRKKNKASICIQAVIRGALQRPKYIEALRDRKEVGGIQEQIELLKLKLSNSEQERLQAVKEAEDRVTKAMASMEDEGMDIAELQHISVKAKLAESDKVLDFLRRERKRLMGLVKTQKSRCERISEQHKEFADATIEVTKRKDEIESYMEVLANNKATLSKNKDVYIGQLKTYRKEVQRGQAYKSNEETVRGVYQDAVERIVALVQEECKDDELVEDIYLLAMECGEFGDSDDKLGDNLDEMDLDDLDDISDSELSSVDSS